MAGTIIFSSIMPARTAISGHALRQSRVCPEHWIQATKKYGANLPEEYILCARRKLKQKFRLMNETRSHAWSYKHRDLTSDYV
jgi:hypothetical protein